MKSFTDSPDNQKPFFSFSDCLIAEGVYPFTIGDVWIDEDMPTAYNICNVYNIEFHLRRDDGEILNYLQKLYLNKHTPPGPKTKVYMFFKSFSAVLDKHDNFTVEDIQSASGFLRVEHVDDLVTLCDFRKKNSSFHLSTKGERELLEEELLNV